MRIRASRTSDYFLNPNYGELTLFRQKFGLLCQQTGEGFTMLSYSVFPTVLIKDRAYAVDEYVYTAEATQSFDNVTQAAQALGLTIAIETGNYINNKKGLINLNSRNLEYSKLGFKLNELPQIDGVYKLNSGDKMVIIGIDGNYDFNTKMFVGALDLVSYEDFLESKLQ